MVPPRLTLDKGEAASLVKEWTSKAEEGTRDFDRKVKDSIAGILEKMNITTKDDFERLEKKVQNLSARLTKLEGGEGKGEA